MEVTKVILTKVSDFWQLAIGKHGFFSGLKFPFTVGLDIGVFTFPAFVYILINAIFFIFKRKSSYLPMQDHCD